MARGDAIHRTTARNARMKDADIGNAQAHNERQKESYVNQDIVTERTPMNVHFKSPSSDYTAMFDDMVSSGTISTRGLKADAEKFGELIFDVNSAYFFNHGGYEFAKQFYADAYKAAIKIVGGEQYILSAVMHADERNRAMSDTLGQDVYHYHFHVVYIPIVEKQILWSKRCKDIERIEDKPVPLSSKVILERPEYESLAMAAKKYVTAAKKESKLQKALDAANRLIAKLKAEIAGLKQELSEYKSVRSKLRTPDLERENAELRGKVQRYEDVIQRNNLWHFFRPHREKVATREDVR